MYLVSNWSEYLPWPAPSSSTWPMNAQSTSSIDRPHLHACTFCFGDQKTTQNTFLGDMALQAPQREKFFFFFFFLPSIAQQIGSKPPPPGMKVLSFVRDVCCCAPYLPSQQADLHCPSAFKRKAGLALGSPNCKQPHSLQHGDPTPTGHLPINQ